MYKIMTKLHTSADNIYAFYMVQNDDGETVEYSVDNPEEAAEQALAILKEIGYADLRIVDDQSYYLDLIYGTKPLPEQKKYTLNIITPEIVIAVPDVIEDIEKNATVSIELTFEEEVDAFHLIVDGAEYRRGMPDWITYEELTSTYGILTLTGITKDHEIEIVVDDIVYSI